MVVFFLCCVHLTRALLSCVESFKMDGIISDSPHVVGEAVREHNCQTILDDIQVPHFQPHGASSSLLNSLYTNANKARVTELLVEAQKLLDMFEKEGEDGSCKKENNIRNLRAIMSALEPYVAMKSQT